MPVLFILMLPVAFAASVKDEDKVDNSFSFAYDATSETITAATSSIRHTFVDDVDFSVAVSEMDGEAPLVGRVRFRLFAKEAVRYVGGVRFTVIDFDGNIAYSEERDVSFTLRPKRRPARLLTFPFEVASGDYKVRVTFSR